MALTKETVIDKIEILEFGNIQIRRATYFLEDGVRVSGPKYHRVAYDPGPIDDLGHPRGVDSEDPKVKAYARIAWTPKVIATHKRISDKGIAGR